MRINPSFEPFEHGFNAGQNQLVWTSVAADLDTPVSLMMKLAGPSRDSFMLESVTGGEARGRYSIIGMKPDLVWECRGKTAYLNRKARFDREHFQPVETDPLTSLRALIAESRIDMPEGLPSAAAGLFGYLGYEMIGLVERLPDPKPDPIGLPDARLMRPTVVVVHDVVKSEVIIAAPAFVGTGLAARAAYAQAAERVSDALRDLDRGVDSAARGTAEPCPPSEPISNFTKDAYFDAVRRAKDYIGAGDIFQVVPAQRWTQAFSLPPFALYRALRRTNPSPYMFYFDFGDGHIAGASPEPLVRVMAGEVTIRPIAGTRKRGEDEAEDRALEADLLSDPKERAEHLMLLDLGRNDVGRVAATGTVRPTEQFIIERFSHVMHIVSNVTGQLAEGKDAVDALLSGLPAGTLSGAPKVRAMEIIHELEPEKRGVYGGAVGYFAANGDMDMCIGLRTAVLREGKLYTQAGGGVVWDSTPEGEYQETVNKARAIWSAAEHAARFDGSGNR